MEKLDGFLIGFIVGFLIGSILFYYKGKIQKEKIEQVCIENIDRINQKLTQLDKSITDL